MHLLEKAMKVIKSYGIRRTAINEFTIRGITGNVYKVVITGNTEKDWECNCQWGTTTTNGEECYHVLATKILMCARITRKPRVNSYYELVDEEDIEKYRVEIIMLPVIEYEGEFSNPFL